MATPKTKSSPLHDFVAKIASTSMPYPHPNDPTVQIFIRPLSFILLPQQNLLRDQGASSLLHTQSLLMSIDLDACFERPISARFCKCLRVLQQNLQYICWKPRKLKSDGSLPPSKSSGPCKANATSMLDGNCHSWHLCCFRRKAGACCWLCQSTRA